MKADQIFLEFLQGVLLVFCRLLNSLKTFRLRYFGTNGLSSVTSYYRTICFGTEGMDFIGPRLLCSFLLRINIFLPFLVIWSIDHKAMHRHFQSFELFVLVLSTNYFICSIHIVEGEWPVRTWGQWPIHIIVWKVEKFLIIFSAVFYHYFGPTRVNECFHLFREGILILFFSKT